MATPNPSDLVFLKSVAIKFSHGAMLDVMNHWWTLLMPWTHSVWQRQSNFRTLSHRDSHPCVLPNSTETLKKNNVKRQSNSNGTRREASQTVDDGCGDNQPVDMDAHSECNENGQKPVCNVVHVPKVW